MNALTTTAAPPAIEMSAPRNSPTAYPPLDELNQVIAIVQDAAKAENTKKNYRRYWGYFESFCVHYGFECLPATTQTVLLFLAYLGSFQKASVVPIGRSAIAHFHNAARLFDPAADPSVSEFLRGLRRHHGEPPDQKRPLIGDEVFAMCESLDELGGVFAMRDRVVILSGFTGCTRISETLGLNRGDVEIGQNVKVMVRKSKTDQEGRGHVRWLKKGTDPKNCPVLALREWMQLYDEKVPDAQPSDPLFPMLWRAGDPVNMDARIDVTRRMSDHHISQILKVLAKQVIPGVDVSKISFHSLRSGHATTATMNGVPRAELMRQGNWTSNAVDIYIRAAEGPENSSSGYLGT